MDNILNLAYLAGFFDGEGCVYILKANAKHGVAFSLEISFTNADKEPLELARSLFGGKVSRSSDSRPKSKPSYRLRIRSNQALSALTQLLPYLRVKRKRAELGVEFQKQLSNRKGGKRNISIEECERYKTSITSMNDKVWNSRPLKVPVEN